MKLREAGIANSLTYESKMENILTGSSIVLHLKFKI